MSDRFAGMDHEKLLKAARLLDHELDLVWAAYNRLYDALVLATPCPHCGAPPGRPCRTRTGMPVRTWSTIHVSRTKVAERAAWPEGWDDE